MAKVPMTYKRRITIAFGIFILALLILCFRVGYVQLVKGDDYSKLAIEQQTKDEAIEAKRGEILDRNNNKLAVSTVKYSLWVRPADLKKGQKKDFIEKVAPIIDKETSELEEELNKNISLVKVAKYLDREETDKIRKIIKDEDLSGISITEETKRYYPLGNFASHLLGSVTDDNNGLSGIEQYYNGYLKGVSGRWIQNKDVNGKSLSYGDQKYYEAENGANLVLTIDSVVQHYAEDAISKAAKEFKADKVSCIVMDTKTGEVLAMASTPSFDPNDSRNPSDEKELKKFKELNEDEQLKYLNQMWRNPCVSDAYVPGSTMKLITTAMALEENVTNVNESFYCSGSIDVSGVILKCWRYYEPHGQENLTEAVGNSCNPVFVQLTSRLGIDKYYEYLDLFGISSPTGIDYPGEGQAIMQGADTAGPVGLATMGYGQGIAVTPIELVTAISALGNDGKLMEPHLVKEIVDSKGNTIKKFEPVQVKQAVSSETSKQMRIIMEHAVEEGGAEAAKVEGYRVGGKTGTANIEADGNKIIASFVGVAPIDDPRITVLIVAENPKTAIFGNVVAAPAGKEIIEKTLKYMNVKPTEPTVASSKDAVVVPSVVGKTSTEAKTFLESKGLKCKVASESEKNKTFKVTAQYPAAGATVKKDDIIYIYGD